MRTTAPCPECVAAAHAKAPRAGLEAARFVAMGTCAHTLDAALQAALTGPLDLRRVLRFGHANRAHHEAAEALQGQLEAGALAVRRHALPAVEASADELRPFVGRTDEHRLLCFRFAMWLSEQGITWSTKRADLRYPGGLADVSADGLFAEVGYVRADHVLAGIDGGAIVAAVPYAYEAGNQWDIAYIIERSAGDA